MRTLLAILFAAVGASANAADLDRHVQAADLALLVCDDKTAASEVDAAARQGDAEAQLRLAEFYENGIGVPRSTADAARWKKEALKSKMRDAAHGDGEAMEWIGRSYKYGWLTEIDEAKSKEWLARGREAMRQKAETGDAQAQYVLAQGIWLSGTGNAGRAEAEPWWKKAIKGFTEAAEAGDAKAQERLGEMYSDGHGTEKNTVLAAKWYRPVVASWVAAADKGDVSAIEQLYLMVHHNKAGLAEDKAAKRWHDVFLSRQRAAAAQECIPAQLWMGKHLESLWYKERSSSKQLTYQASMWWTIVESSGDTRYRSFVDEARLMKKIAKLSPLELELVANKAARCVQTSYRICE